MYINKCEVPTCWAYKSKLGKGSEGQARAWETYTEGLFKNEAILLYCYFSFNYQKVHYVVTQKFTGGDSKEKNTLPS